jgi:integrase
MQWADVNLDRRGSIFVRQGKSKNARRHIPLTPRAHAILTARKALAGESLFVWRGTDRYTPLSRHYAAQQFIKIRKKLGLRWDCCVHSTRHTFCTRLGESGCDAFTLCKLAGHSSVKISERYCHPTPPRLESAIAALDKFSGTGYVTNLLQQCAEPAILLQKNRAHAELDVG